MKKKKTRPEYLEKRNKVVEYINNNLDKKISISELAKISNLSKFHFHRIIKSLLGEPIGNYITRTRIETATLLIRYSNLKIQDISYKIGYDKASSLNKIFKQYYGITPSEYRKNKTLKINHIVSKKSNFKLNEPKIIEVSDKEVVYIQINGEYIKHNIDKVWTELSEFVKVNKLFYKEIESFGISYDDPSVTQKEMCRYEACYTIRQSIYSKGNVGTKKIKGGKFAVFSYKGDYENWGAIYDFIFDKWLINSYYELRNQPVMEKYLKIANQSEKTSLNIEIYLPIKNTVNET